MDSRRDFLKKAILLSGTAGLSTVLPPSIQRALAIDPAPGSTYLDAEHVVILMQENRSFDHCFGTLRGVRGFNDPRAITLPDKNLVWLQTNKAGETYAPFRFNIRDTKATWMGSVPHSRSSQVDANNLGKYDKWLEAKRSGNKKYADMPLTMGHYTRDDIPFNYAMADAFTVCDQHFCSAMTSTWPNRLFMWSGTIRGEKSGDAKAYIRNDIPYGEAHWKTFPERLEENGISWRVYQNEITAGGGFKGQESSWLGNFGCNQLENFSQYNVRFFPKYIRSLHNRLDSLPGEIADLESKLGTMSSADKDFDKTKKAIATKKEVLQDAKEQLVKWDKENFDKLSPEQKNLFHNAFTTNEGDPDYHQLSTLSYKDNGVERELPIPKGDVLYQFRKDVDSGALPTVSWLVPSQNFSDHPSAPWYGAWFTSEILDILTKNPETWKKTIFILTYDENDGYFDHVPPFVAPDSEDPQTGKCSPGVNVTGVEFIRREQELNEGISKKEARSGPIGLGFRVPMIIASPWSRGGRVCSEVLDHTSSIQFLEGFLNEKFNKEIKQTNISTWRRTVCGNLMSAFKAYNGESAVKLPFLSRDPFIEKIYNAKFKREPNDFRPLSAEEISAVNRDPSSAPLMALQEPGTRPSCALPYELYAEAVLSPDKKNVQIQMEARNDVFGKQSDGAPFNVYAPGKYLAKGSSSDFEAARAWHYAVTAGDKLIDSWILKAFEEDGYHLRVYGPNGFFREFIGNAKDPEMEIRCHYEQKNGKTLTGNVELHVNNKGSKGQGNLVITDNAYKTRPVKRALGAGEATILLDLSKSSGWYDFTVRLQGNALFSRRYAGRVETGRDSISDPYMGRAV